MPKLIDYTSLCDNKSTKVCTHLLQITKIICLWLSPFLCFHSNSKVITDNGKTKCLHFIDDLGKVAGFLCFVVPALCRKHSLINTCEDQQLLMRWKKKILCDN